MATPASNLFKNVSISTPKRQSKKLCQFRCGREVEMPTHACCRACYSSIRVWMRNKTASDRRQRANNLAIYLIRMNAIDEKAIVIQKREDLEHKSRRRGRT